MLGDRAWLGKLHGELCALIAPVFAQARSRFAAFVYVAALLAVTGDRKSCWQLGEEAGHATPRRMQALLAIDDTLFQRTGPKVHAIGWFRDGSAKGPHQVGLGSNWVIAAITVTLPFLSRPVALPALARLVHKDIKPAPASRLVLARYELAPPRTGRRGRPRAKGKRLPSLAALVGTASFAPVTVRRYGKTVTVQAAALTCLWHGVLGTRPVQVVLIRDKATAGYDLAMATTDLAASPAAVIERYAARWPIEVAIEDARQIFGAGEARNRLAAAVHRTLPFTLACQTIAMLWYATAGHHPGDVDDHRARAPWYRTKAEPSTADMIAKLRRVLIAAKYRPVQPFRPTPAEIHAVRLAWEGSAA